MKINIRLASGHPMLKAAAFLALYWATTCDLSLSILTFWAIESFDFFDLIESLFSFDFWLSKSPPFSAGLLEELFSKPRKFRVGGASTLSPNTTSSLKSLKSKLSLMLTPFLLFFLFVLFLFHSVLHYWRVKVIFRRLPPFCKGIGIYVRVNDPSCEGLDFS